MYLFEHGNGNDLPSVRCAVWATYNGVTELVDHGTLVPSGQDCTDRHLHSIWFGRGAAVKARASQLRPNGRPGTKTSTMQSDSPPTRLLPPAQDCAELASIAIVAGADRRPACCASILVLVAGRQH
jgi:hypothetical protein